MEQNEDTPKIKEKTKTIIVISAVILALAAIILTFVLLAKSKKEDNNTETSKTVASEELTEKIEIITEGSTTYVYYGSYPQSEIVAKASDCGTYEKAWGETNDYILDAELYTALSNLPESEWTANGDAIVEGDTYRRIKAENATSSTSADANYYNWTNSDEYHYFKYEPIKWRILEQSDDELFLLSEIVLDGQKYNTKITNITWETSTIRSWLNGYGADQNDYGTDYSESNFINTAFTAQEQTEIQTTTITNADNVKSDTEGGNDTEDKIYLLSEAEVYGELATQYGFANDYDGHDVARVAKSSTYAKAMGVSAETEEGVLGNCFWWLRSPGSYTGLTILVRPNGSVYRGGQHADSKTRGVRPAMRIEY